MNFAFVALFISLSTHAFMAQSRHRLALFASAVVAVVCTQMGHGEIALLVAGFCGVMAHLVVTKWVQNV